ncbi:MAG: hypothetical protein J6Y43_00905 [Clostridia bacterium]|nr:hypothetical protein [Clostridia bacterium]
MKKKIGIVALVVVMALSAVFFPACGGRKEEIPDFESDKGVKTVRFAGLCEPPPAGYYDYGADGKNESFITVDRYREIKECGIDIIIAHAQNDISKIGPALECAAAAGVKYIAQYQSAVNFGSSTPDKLRTAIGDLLDNDACYGIVVRDEPSVSSFGALGRAYNVFKQVSDKYFYINLLPTYGVSGLTYPQYIETYCKNVGTNFISTDFYPYNYDGLVYRTLENWLYNLETVQKAAVRYNMEHWEYLQGNKAYPASKIPDYNDLRQEIYVSMCYGTQLFQYYCYFTPAEFGPDEELRCLIDYYGNRTDIYEAAKKINNEIHDFEHVYMNFVDGWKGVMTFVGSNNERGENSAFNMCQSPIVEHGRIKSVETTEDLVCGAYRNEDEYDAFMFVNYAIPGLNKTSDVKVKFRGATKAICYIQGERVEKDLTGGTVELSLGAGEGVFVIPVNA